MEWPPSLPDLYFKLVENDHSEDISKLYEMYKERQSVGNHYFLLQELESLRISGLALSMNNRLAGVTER